MDPLQQHDPWAKGQGKGLQPAKGKGRFASQPGPFQAPKAGARPRNEVLHARKGGGKGPKGFRDDQLQRLEARIQDLMNEILNAGGCPTSASLLERASAEFPEAQKGNLDPSQLGGLTMLLRKEQALKQFLLSMRSLCSVWSVKDAERAFIASSFVKRSYDVAEWSSLRLGPSLSQHPFWSEVFYEFSDSQARWMAHATDPAQLMDGVTALELLFQHRVDSGNGQIDFEKEIRYEDFEHWLYSKGYWLEDNGVCINRHKFGLVMGSMNGALAQQDRLQQQAEAKYLEKLLELKEGELSCSMADSCEAQAAYRDFHQRWRRVARSQSVAELAYAVCLWAQHKLGCETNALRPLAMALAVELKAHEGDLPADDLLLGAGVSSTGALQISPLELEETVRRQLDALVEGKALGLSGLARLERNSLGVGASMEAMLPGEGTFLNFLVSKSQLRETVESHLAGQVSMPSSMAEGDVDVSEVLRKADEVLRDLRPTTALLDLQLLGQLEEKLRASGLSVNLAQLLLRQRPTSRSRFGSGWALSVQDVKAYDLLQHHASLVLRSCGDAARHHFGASAAQLGLPPGAASPRQGPEGLHFEAAVLAQLRGKRMVEAATAPCNGLAASEAQAASRAAEALAQWNASAEQSAEGGGAEMFQDVDDSFHAGALSSAPATAQQGLEALGKVDFLEDVESSSCWQALYAPSLGSLVDFLAHQAEQLYKHHLRFLVLAAGALPNVSLAPRLVRLPLEASVEALQAAVAAGQAKTVAAQLTALCVDEPHIGEAAVYYFKEGLKTLKQRFESSSSLSAVTCSLAVAALQFLPQQLRPHLGQRVVLPCLKEEVAWAEQCRSAAERLGCSSMLLALGQLWDIRAWTLDSLDFLPDSGELHFLHALGVEAPTTALAAVVLPQPKAGSETPETVESETASAESSAPLLTIPLEDGEKYRILQQIRSEFCLDQSNAAQLQRNLGGALKRLGEDLYREQHHFVFELLQNGDDNKYRPGDVPCYKLILCEDRLVALSNELGFEQANVESLCSVDSSTKPQIADGAERIGKKGIGFKSVFKITDTPIIHSAGWHFRFNARLKLDRVNIKELGYIVPESVPEEDQQFPQWTTEIRLPFRSELGNEEKAVLKEDFQKLDGSLLLNLNKLRCLVLQHCTSSQLSPDDRPLGPAPSTARCLRSVALCEAQRLEEVEWRLVQISDGEVKNWLCVEGSFPFSTRDPKMVKMKISFPLPASGSLSEWREEHPAPQQTFCYLPLRSFGWRVVLHANFDVTASRNELHTSAWNRKIKELLPRMMCFSHRIIKEHLMPADAPPFSAVPWLKVAADPALQASKMPKTVPYGFFLRFMPLLGELGGGDSDFFAGVEKRIWQQLKEEKCVLSAEGDWLQPGQIFQAPEMMKEVITPDILAQFHNGLCYMHADFGTGLSADRLRLLGVRTPGAALDVLLTVLAGMVAADSQLTVAFVRKVLALSYHLMWGNSQEDAAPMDSAAQRVETLKKLRLLPLLRRGEAPPGLEVRGAVAEEGLFLPEAVRRFPKALLDSLDLKIVSPELFEGKEGQLVRRLLDHLGLRLLSPDAVVLEGVMPLLEKLGNDNGVQEMRTVSLCLAYLASVGIAECAEGWAKKFKRQSFEVALQSCLKLPVTNRTGDLWFQRGEAVGTVLLSREFHLFLTEDALSRGDVEKAKAHEVLAEAMEAMEGSTFVAPQLLVAAEEIQVPCRQLAQFLAKQCGVTLGCFQVLKLSASLTVGEIIREKPHLKDLAEEMAQEVDANVLAQSVDVVDFASPMLAAALAGGTDLHSWVVASYVAELRDHMAANLTLKAAGAIKTCPSAIAAVLTSSPWVQGTSGNVKPCHARFLWEDGEMASPEPKLKPEMRRFLDKHLVLVREVNSCQLSFRAMLKQLGAQQLSAKDVLQLLREWSTTKLESTEGEMTDAYATLHMLQQHRRCLEVDDALKDQHEKLIFVPNEIKLTKRQHSMHTNTYRGKWLSPSSCCVMEDRKVSQNMYFLSRMEAVRELELHYSQALKEPFLKTCGIAEWPTEMHRLHSLELAAKTRQQDAFRLAEILLEQLFTFAGPGQQRRHNEELDPHYAEELRRGFAKYRALPTNQGWMAWRDEAGGQDGEGQVDPSCVEIFLPDATGRNNGKVLLSSRLARQFRNFQKLGMRHANDAAGTVPTVQEEPLAEPEVQEQPETLELEGEQQDSKAESKLRLTMAYLQCWMHKVQPYLYHALDARAEQLSGIQICVVERLLLGGREVEAYFAAEQSMLYVAQPAELHLPALNAALQQLLLKSLALMAQQAAQAQNVGIELLIRLTQSEKPGLAARRVLQDCGYDGEDPATLPLVWWFGLPPLDLEEALPTKRHGHRPGTNGLAAPNGWGAGAFVNGHGGHGASSQAGAASGAPGGGAVGGGAPGGGPGGGGSGGGGPGANGPGGLGGAGDEDADPWANWVGLAAERAPVMHEAAALARRAGRPHEELEAHAFELEDLARGGGHGRGGSHGARWAERRAREVEDFIQGLGREENGNAQLLDQLRGHSAELRALAAAGALPEAAFVAATAAGAAVPGTSGTAEAVFQHFEGEFHLQPSYAGEMDALPEDAPHDLGFPTTGRLSEEEERRVAEWGEEWVFKTLKRKYAPQRDVSVHWLNQQHEQFEFYDLCVVFPDGRQDFYEVKSTVTADKRLLEVSEKQVLEASKLKDRFNIVRVFGAGSPAARMLLVPNPSAQCTSKATTGIELLLKLP